MNHPPISIRLDIVPPTATAQQKGACVVAGRIKFYKKAKVRKAEQTLAALLAPYAPKEPFTGPVHITVCWTFPYRKTESRRITRDGIEVRHTTRPDLDNLEKNLLDTMTQLRFWLDDSQICLKETYKARGPKPGISIFAYETSRTYPPLITPTP